MRIVMDTKDLRALLKFRKQYKYCQVFDSGDNTDGEGVWHCDVHFGDDPDALKDGDGEEVYSFDSIYNDHSKYWSEEGRRKSECRE